MVLINDVLYLCVEHSSSVEEDVTDLVHAVSVAGRVFQTCEGGAADL